MEIRSHFKRFTATMIVIALIMSLVVNPCAAQFPQIPQVPQFFPGSGGGANINLSGRRINVNLHVSAATIAEWMKSGKLKFQESVLMGNTSRAAHYIKPEFVNDPIKNYPPIYYAAINGNIQMINLLASNDATMRYRLGGKSLGYIAAANGHNEAAQTLVRMGAGSEADITRGSLLYADNRARQRKEFALVMAGAAALLAAMIQSSSNDSPSETDAADQRFMNWRQDCINHGTWHGS